MDGAGNRAAGAIAMRDVAVWRWVAAESRRAVLLDGVEWFVGAGEHWVVLGPNGAGKTTLLNMAGAVSHPSSGEVDVLGRRLGRVDMRALRERIGFVDPGISRALRGRLTATEIVLTGATGSIALQPDRIDAGQRRRAAELMELVGATELADRRYQDCSQGERQRLLLARAMMVEPELLLLDEPTSGLDLPSRERLIASLGAMSQTGDGLTTVTVTHHLEEIPDHSTHALLLAGGRVTASGPIAEVMTGEAVSACFGIEVEVARNGDRWAAMVGSARLRS